MIQELNRLSVAVGQVAEAIGDDGRSTELKEAMSAVVDAAASEAPASTAFKACLLLFRAVAMYREQCEDEDDLADGLIGEAEELLGFTRLTGVAEENE